MASSWNGTGVDRNGFGVARQIQTIWTQFEYGTQFYQYLIETCRWQALVCFR